MVQLFHRRTGEDGRKTKGGNTEIQRKTVTLASATLLNRKQLRATMKRQSWMQEAWAFYDTIGELRFACRWLGNAVSRGHLFIGRPQPEGGGDPEPHDDPPDLAVAALEELHEGQLGQSEMLRRLAMHLAIPGESFLIGMDPRPEDGPDGVRRWLVASNEEFSTSGGRPRVKLPDTGENVELDPEQSTIIRIWNPHPRQAWEADSSVRANLPVLREVMSLSQHITATVESRLAGAGILCIPHSATMPNPKMSESDGVEPLHPDPFVDGLMQAMITPISDRDDASAVVPVLVKVPDEAVGKIQHLSFATELDSKVTEMREAAIRRFATGSDLPPEVVLGMTGTGGGSGSGSANHWSSWLIEESATRVHVEPLLGCICDALTQQYLWPSLKAAGVEDPEQFVIWYDLSELTQRPDRSAEAQALFDKGALSAEALLRHNGFSDDDVPNDEEKRNELARQLVLVKPELLPALAPFVGFEGMERQLQQAVAPTPPDVGEQPEGRGLPPGGGQRPSNVRELPSGSGGTGRPAESGGSGRNEPPARAASAEVLLTNAPSSASPDDPSFLLMCEHFALRALELAGKRLLTQSPRGVRGKPEAQEVHTYDLHTIAPAPQAREVDKLLTGAYDLMRATIGDATCVQAAVDTYCRALLVSGRPHRREYLAETLLQSGCLNAA